MKKNPTDSTKLFGLSVSKIKGGYHAQAEIATNYEGAKIVLNATARKEDHVAGITEPPRAAALKQVLQQAAKIAGDPALSDIIPTQAKYAIVTMHAVRGLAEMAQDGDRDARVGLRRLANSDNETFRKAVRAQRLFGGS